MCMYFHLQACERVVGLDITISRVADSSIPAIGGVQVWGQPCIRCSQDQVEKLYKSWSRIIRHGDTYFPLPLTKKIPDPAVINLSFYRVTTEP